MITLTESLQMALNESKEIRVKKAEVINKMRQDKTLYINAYDPNVKGKGPGPDNTSISYIDDGWYVNVNFGDKAFTVKDDNGIKTIIDLIELINNSSEAKKAKVTLNFDARDFNSGRGRYANTIKISQYTDNDLYSAKKNPEAFPPKFSEYFD